MVVSGVTLTVHARAQQEEPLAAEREERLSPAEKTFELKFGMGYTQGFGNVAPNQSILSVSSVGVGVGIDGDYRIDAHESVGIEGQYQEFGTQANDGARGVAINVGVTHHTTPHQRGDFWGRLGTGYRMLWDVHPGFDQSITNLYHGIDVATLKLGYDIRVDRQFAISPVVGADLQTFNWKDAALLDNVQVGTFIYAGIQGRFDAVPVHGQPVMSGRR
jgi:hypothetical protein